MKTSLRRGSPSGKRIIIAALLVVSAVLLLMFFRGGLGAAASILATPIVSAKAWFYESSSSLPLYLRTKAGLIARITELEEERALYDAEREELERLHQEEERMLPENTMIRAGVIAGPRATPYDTVLIDRGARHGIKEGALVSVAGTDRVVGDIVAVYGTSALVRLATAPGMRATAFVFGPDVFVDAEGVGGGVLRIAVPQGMPLHDGDSVVLPGLGAGRYGTVASVERAESSPYQYGYITSEPPLTALRFVDVAPDVRERITGDEMRRAVEHASSTLFLVPAVDHAGTSTAPVP